MTGRHRRAHGTARRALLGTVPLVGTAGVATGLLTGMAPGDGRAADPAAPGAVASTATEPAVTRTVPGKGETALDAVGGARDAVVARRSRGEASETRVSTVAEELRSQAAERAGQARAAGDAELAGYHEQEAERQERARSTSRPVVPAPDRIDSGDGPGVECTSDDLLELGPLTMTGPGSDCGPDPWIAEQLDED